MSATSSPPAFVDPLAEEVVPVVRSRDETDRLSATRERTSILAPDVEGRTGAKAIDLVRSKGLIAAIETVEITECAQHGIVIDQDPQADTQMVRDGVVTLRIAQAPAEPSNIEDDHTSPIQSPSSTTCDENGERKDDTAEWFAALGPMSDTAGPVTCPRRRRKHRHKQSPVPEKMLDTPPAPDLPIYESKDDREVVQRAVGPFVSVITELLVRLSSLSVSSAWRRRGLALAGTVAVLSILMRGGGPHPHHQISPPLADAPVSPLRAATIDLSRLAQSKKRRSLMPRRSGRSPARARRSPSRRAPRRSIIAGTNSAETVAKGVSFPRQTSVTERSSSAAAPRSAPFIYLGK